DAAEAAAGLARAQRRVERERRRRGLGVMDVAVGAVQVGGVAEYLALLAEDIDFPLTELQRRFHRLSDARAVSLVQRDAVLHDLDQGLGTGVELGVTLRLQVLLDLLLREVLRDGDRKRNRELRRPFGG